MGACGFFRVRTRPLVQKRSSAPTAESAPVVTGAECTDGVDENAAVPVELNPGQVSFHHGYLLHASSANSSDTPRIALAVTYVTPETRTVLARRDFAVLARGRDRCGYFRHIRPRWEGPELKVGLTLY